MTGIFFMFNTSIGDDIEEAKRWLNQGELVAIPTETVYGLASNGFNPLAVAKIYEAKNRPQFNPLILHVAGVDQIYPLVDQVPENCLKLISKFSPGPITYLLPKSDRVPEIVTAGSPLVAIRIPDHPLALELLKGLDYPLAAPSANPSGYVSPVSAAHVLHGLSGKIPYVLDGGECLVGLESTIVSFENHDILVHRLGGVTPEQLQEVTGCKIKMSLSHASPMAPGQLKSHYATHTPLMTGDVDDFVHRHPDSRIGVISFQKSYKKGVAACIALSEKGDLNEAASHLFQAMRQLDGMELDYIISEPFPAYGVGLAINDRLGRAVHANKNGH